MPRRVLETLAGVGEVYAGDVLLRRTQYDLSLWTDDPGDGQPRKEHVEISGHIDITGIAEAVVLASPDELTLRLADGRRLPIRLTGTGGSIAGRAAAS